MLLLTVIIPTHNSQSGIVRCIKSLKSQSFPRNTFEIIVVDDGSEDQTLNFVRQEGVDQLIVTKPCFQGKARNIGVGQAMGEFIAFIDSDCEAGEGWIKTIMTELKQGKAISGPIENGNSQSRVAWAEYFLEFGGFDEYRKHSNLSNLPGCNAACTKEDFLRSDGFIETKASEDILLSNSLKKNGVELKFLPSMKINHFCRTEIQLVKSNMEKLGSFFVKTRKLEPSLRYSFLAESKWYILLIFFGKILSSWIRAIKAKKLTKFFSSFFIILIVNYSFCKGVLKEIN